jgi:hypothetical protein
MRMNRIFVGRAVILIFALFFGGLAASAQTAAPRIFFTDLTSGPNTGGQNNLGTFLTIYGTGFGTSQASSTVTVGGGLVNNCPVWGATWLWYQKITCQIGASAATGNVVVTVGGQASTCENVEAGCSFTVRAGNIYFASTSGSDSGTGSFSAPWQTIVKSRSAMVAGDITYVENGVSQTSVDNYNAALAVMSSGTSANPIALVAYPGASVTIGADSLGYGVRTPAISGGPFSNWVLAGFNLHAADSLEIGATNWRIVANTAQCLNGQGQDACMQGAQGAGNLTYYGNYIYNSGLNCPASNCKQYHALYLTTDTNHVWIGWNEINPDPARTGHAGCRAIQFNSTPEGAGTGLDQYDLHIHDNFIHNAICDGINFNTVNPDAGTVEAYNNVIWHVGTGPNPPVDQESNYTCFNIGSASVHTNPVLIYNNTLYDCGAVPDSDAGSDKGMFSPYVPVQISNNIIYQSNSGVPYITNNTSGNASKMTGSGNIWYGAGAKPSGVATTNDLSNVNPLLSAPSSGTFTLQATSPAIGAGTAAKYSAYDHNGLIRPSPPSIGAYEFTSGTVVQRPNPPTGLVVVVN